MRGEEKLTFAEQAWVVSNQHLRESATGVALFLPPPLSKGALIPFFETVLLLYGDYESSIYLLIYLLICLSTYSSTYPSTSLPPFLHTYLPTHLPSHLPIHLHIYLPM